MLSSTKAGREWLLLQSLILMAHAINARYPKKGVSNLDLVWKRVKL